MLLSRKIVRFSAIAGFDARHVSKRVKLRRNARHIAICSSSKCTLLHPTDPLLRQKSTVWHRNDILKAHSTNEKERTSEAETCVRALRDSLRASAEDKDAPAIGIAGIQIGIKRRVVAVEMPEANLPFTILFNPQCNAVRAAKGDNAAANHVLALEGCLSVPSLYGFVQRHATIDVQFLDINARQRRARATGMVAVLLQHEIDHCNGILFTHRVPQLTERAQQGGFVASRELQAMIDAFLENERRTSENDTRAAAAAADSTSTVDAIEDVKSWRKKCLWTMQEIFEDGGPAEAYEPLPEGRLQFLD